MAFSSSMLMGNNRIELEDTTEVISSNVEVFVFDETPTVTEVISSNVEVFVFDETPTVTEVISSNVTISII